MSQPETELDSEVLNDDAAVLDMLARKREPQPEAEPEEPQAEAEPEPEAPEVEEDPEIDLGDLKAKKSEILAWKSGQMMEADYRQKTAAAAEAKREAQAQAERVAQERSHYANQLDVLISQLQTELVGDQQYLAQLATEDPIEWVRQNAVAQQKIQRFQQAVSERQVIEQRASQEQERKQSEWVRQQSEALHAKLPEWRDPAVKAKELADMEAYLRAQGYGDDLGAFMDHRLYLMARKAFKAEQAASARESAKEKKVSAPPPKALKPGPATNNQAEQDAYKDALRRAKSGREEDLLALMAAKRRKY